MTFTARVQNWYGRDVSVTWADGKLTGDASAVVIITSLAEQLEGQPVGLPTGPVTTTDHLSSALSTLDLMQRVLGYDLTATGDVPQLDAVPRGAIA